MENRKGANPHTEKIDIDKESSELSVYSEGSLEELDKHNEIKNRWFKERTIVVLSAAVILLILFFSMFIVTYPTDEASSDWGRQTLSALVGFAAGAIWQTKARK